MLQFKNRSAVRSVAFAMLAVWLLALGVGIANACLLHTDGFSHDPLASGFAPGYAPAHALHRGAPGRFLDGRTAWPQPPVSIRFLRLTL